MLGSTPLEMDDLIYANVVHDSQSLHHQKSLHLQDSANEGDEHSLFKLNASRDESGFENGENDRRNMSELLALVNDLREQVRLLNDQLGAKGQENADLNSCLIKQTTLGENLSSVLRSSEDKNRQLEGLIEKNSAKLESLQIENGRHLFFF